MKTNFKVLAIAAFLCVTLTSCKKDVQITETSSKNTVMKISELSSQYNFTFESNISRTKTWEEVVNDDIQGGLSGAGWGAAVGGVWGGVCGGLAFGGCNSFLDYVALGAGSGSGNGLVVPIVNFNSSNSLEYIGQLHNKGIVAGYDSSGTFYNSNGNLDSSKVENYIVTFISTQYPFAGNFNTNLYSSLLAHHRARVGSFNDFVDAQHYSASVALILKNYYHTLTGLNSISDMESYSDGVVGVVNASTDLTSDEKQTILIAASIGKYSAILSFVNF